MFSNELKIFCADYQVQQGEIAYNKDLNHPQVESAHNEEVEKLTSDDGCKEDVKSEMDKTKTLSFGITPKTWLQWLC